MNEWRIMGVVESSEGMNNLHANIIKLLSKTMVTEKKWLWILIQYARLFEVSRADYKDLLSFFGQPLCRKV